MSVAIEVDNLKRTYEGTLGMTKKKTIEALRGISFTVDEGEIFGLLGPNGAGKTTAIKVLTTLLAPSSGKAKIFGYDCFGEEKFIRDKINFIFGGERGLYWRLSAYENLQYFGDIYKVPGRVLKERIPKLIKLVNLQGREHEKVESFSKGMKQRLQIARGLINDPRILFLDEPTIGLDPIGAKDLRNIILKLKEEGKTILLTTHYMHEADELCDRIAIINNGELIDIDTPKQLKLKYLEDENGSLEEVYIKLIGGNAIA
ncbi:ABC transporter ATP-binding protein [Proteiniborus sp. MB09-C3]|uniref:ABC transporter ATP-binding protein n=1 Tax=Proteiniborus sp. MB09-C3 TaxID=3050072 RepID=UPI002554845C|nr:ABC transporter ATP-binding protein [Proteiniborus sp. MB09-C3]WIV12467.1 ABC transporter ATP-binding protein [Proteiniborus sp. MB09-C3]